ncbi:MAG: ThiF family adenylyltransferase [Chloroflexi bacterium]|nr:ThiF family adenylyltransferase [Chloroflexota bacterium]
MNVRVEQRVWNLLWGHLKHAFSSQHAPEFGALALLGLSGHPKRPALLLADAVEPDHRSFEFQSRDTLIFSSRYLRRAVLEARKRGLKGIAILHTHPTAADRVDFSAFDNTDEPDLVANLRELLPGAWVMSMVCGERSLKARVWPPNGNSPKPVDRLWIVGDHIVERSLQGEPPPPAPPPAAMFDRALELTDAGAQARLRRLRVGVVGAGGTGSLVAELLVRAGVGQVVLIDDEKVEEVNLNRVLHARSRMCAGDG